MKRVRELEQALLRVEAGIVVGLVLLMLGLAGYNIFYRDVLASLQRYWAHSGPPVESPAAPPGRRQTPAEVARAPEAKAAEAGQPKSGEAGGFGGAFGAHGDDGGASGGETDDEAEGFEGAFGKKHEPPPAPAEAEDEDEDEDDGGFGGAFGKKHEHEPAPEDEDEDEELAPDDDQFANLPDITADKAEAEEGPVGGPPPPGSFAAWAMGFIDRIKLGWIDTLLPRMVIIVSFFGAALATGRRKHINVDALSRLLSERGRRAAAVITNLLTVVVCILLAVAGSRLVAISREYPNKLLPFADEWVMQLMFPIGFGLLAVHFGVRLAEAIVEGPPPEEGAESPPKAEAPAKPEPPEVASSDDPENVEPPDEPGGPEDPATETEEPETDTSSRGGDR